ncbi:Gfo/Idh/MocA family protein [Paenibacillus sacheonensis]|uniref:Gfo/Idh/MocA family oxidoreductase n=1 Tax=Paenibacillus sacheonensis TaxID=742054 RepID=A0A7X4YNG2_9BACL|nr:Gfo/Idh/MocA family oxidoreductase [Paenibacillus sacheonensis]MBM7565529.1 putative dehydrogenase [Paenibacillus sacheonensis]NBC69550.1 Gfo/Idh/MocA family oxidoreductase [Paenibacillus sacheonensis]
MSTQLKAVVVGCNMGKNQAFALAQLPEYELAALCDLQESTARRIADGSGNPAVYTDFAAMLREVRPDVAVIATPNGSHAALSLLAAEAGVRGIYCEKPMAINLGDARRLARVCEERGIALVVGHQRRMTAVYRTMRDIMDSGALGDIQLIRGMCAGDLLSDGTHLIDSMLYLLQDAPVRRVTGQVNRSLTPAFTGKRYGHDVESGAMAVLEFEGGVRGELFTGECRMPDSGYQDIEIIGSKGRLRRRGDGSQPPLLVADERGGWRPVPVAEERESIFLDAFRAMAASIRGGTPHPMSGASALAGLEALMAIFESARRHAPMTLPLAEERFPLEAMIDEGRF